MNTPSFAALLQRYFAEHLRTQRNVSPHTLTAYADTFRLLLKFLSARFKKTIDQLTFAQLSPEAMLAFLDYLERERRNVIRTRNARLAAIHAFVRFALIESGPDFVAQAQRILAALWRHVTPSGAGP